MANVLHRNLTGVDALHPATFVQSTDPGSVGANLLWVDTSVGPPYILRIRNASNTAWLLFAAGTQGPVGPAGPVGVPGPTTVVAFSAGIPGQGNGTIIGQAPPYLCLQDRKVGGGGSGTFTSGADRQRDLNTVVRDDVGIGNIVSNQFVLPAATWHCRISCPAAFVDAHVAWLYNVTGGYELVRGQSSYSSSTSVQSESYSLIVGPFSLTTPSVLEIRHRCQTTKALTGFGVQGTTVLGGTTVIPYDLFTSAEFWLDGPPPPFLGATTVTENPNVDRLAARRLISGWTMPPPGGNG